MRIETIKAHSFDEFQTLLEKEIEMGFSPTLAIIFQSISHDPQPIIEWMGAQSISVFGSSTHSEIFENEVSEKTIVVMLLDHYLLPFQF